MRLETNTNVGTTTSANGDFSAAAATTPRVSVLFSHNNHPDDDTSTLVTVDAVCQALTAFGLSGSRQFVVYAVHRSTDGTEVETPLYQDGSIVSLTALHNRVWLQTEGTYRVKAVGVPRFSAVLTCTPTIRPPLMLPTVSATSTEQPEAPTAKALYARTEDTFTYTNANTIVPFPDVQHNTVSSAASFDAAHKVFTVLEGVWHVSAQLRVMGLVGGTYFEVSLMSGLDVVARDRFDWGEGCLCAAVSMAVDAVVASTQTVGKALHVQFATDADTSTAFFYPHGTKLTALYMGAAS